MENKLNNTQIDTILIWANKHNIEEKVIRDLIMNLQKINKQGTIVD